MSMRKAGYSYAEIAEATGLTEGGAYRLVKRVLKRWNEKLAEDTQEVRRLELSRLDEMLQALWPKVQKGNQGAVDRALRIMDRRSKYLGLDAPTSLRLPIPPDDQVASITFSWDRGNTGVPSGGGISTVGMGEGENEEGENAEEHKYSAETST